MENKQYNLFLEVISSELKKEHLWLKIYTYKGIN